jgi:hypothetical protein
MKKILEGPSQRVGTIFQSVDNNFIEVCNSILRIAFPDCTLKGYAETEPETPAPLDCYLVKEDATIWELIVEKDQVIYWSGIAWLILAYKITEIAAAQNASDTHILLGKYIYHEQVPGQDTIGDWRQYASTGVFYTQWCETGNAVQGAGTWVTKQSISA